MHQNQQPTESLSEASYFLTADLDSLVCENRIVSCRCVFVSHFWMSRNLVPHLGNKGNDFSTLMKVPYYCYIQKMTPSSVYLQSAQIIWGDFFHMASGNH